MAGGAGSKDNRTRKMIYNYIKSYPGVSFGKIKDFFELNESTLKYHLVYLERTKDITSRREGRRRCYFSSQHEFDDNKKTDEPDFSVFTRNQQVILKLIIRNPGITRTELLSKTKLNRKTFGYNIDRLVEQKTIWVINSSDEIGYEYITKDKLYKEMYNGLLMKLLSNEIDEETFHKIKKKLELIDIDEI